jgi:hypothetical protein
MKTFRDPVEDWLYDSAPEIHQWLYGDTGPITCRAMNGVRNMVFDRKLVSMQQLRSITDKEWLESYNFGKGSLVRLREALPYKKPRNTNLARHKYKPLKNKRS